MATASELLKTDRADLGHKFHSLLTIEAADELAVFDLSGDWSELDADEKAKYLVLATRMIRDPLLFPGLVLGAEEEYDAAYAAAQTACFHQVMFLVRNLDDIRDAENAASQGADVISSPVTNTRIRYSRLNSRAPDAKAALERFCNFRPILVR